MDWQLLKDKVTEEVMRQLQADKASASPEKVQQMVVAALGGAKTEPTPAVSSACATPASSVSALPVCEVGADFKTDVLAVVAGPVCDQVTAALKALSGKAKVTVVSGGTPSSRLADLEACGQIVCEGNEAIARRLVTGANTIVVPVITTSVASKVASLIGDCLPSAVLVQAALQGKRAIIANESLVAPAHAAWSVRRKVEEVQSALRTLGFSITDLKGVTGLDAKGTGKGFVPAYTPHPAVLASRAAKAEFSLETVTPVAAKPATADYDRDMAKMIDHTLLKPEATADQVTKLCKEAAEYGFWSVCVNPSWVPLCAKLLKGTPVKVCTVIGFPLGATSANAKALETVDAIEKGAHEVDMVLNVGALKSGQYDAVLNDIKAVVQAARGKALTKVILETGLLTNEEKVKACQLSKEAGADYVKTSTGFGPGGATPEDIALMRKTVGPSMGVKASGGIRDYDAATAVVKAGATRIGASASINIVKRVKPQPAAKDKY